MADQTKVDYEALQAASQAFKQQADAIKKVESSLKSKAQGIRSTWIGKGANEFQKEFESNITPTYDKLVNALNEGGKVLGDLSKMFKDAEQEAKQIIVIVIN
jgi:WXG100 family type VII secretion target